MMTSAQVVETSVNITTNSPSQDYTHPDDHIIYRNVSVVIVVKTLKWGKPEVNFAEKPLKNWRL